LKFETEIYIETEIEFKIEIENEIETEIEIDFSYHIFEAKIPLYSNRTF
jgi:hypothetical protein